MRSSSFLGAMLCTPLLAICLHAQVPTGTLSGIARDPGGASISGASVLATDLARGTTRQTVANSDGSFVLSDLLPGTYKVLLMAPGFADIEYPNLRVEPGRTITLNTSFSVAKQTSTVNVSAVNSGIDLTQSMLQGQITSQTIQSIPLNGRNFLELAFLLPGNRPGPTFDPTKTNTIEISSAGGFGRGGNITIDGGDNNDEVVGGTLSNLPQDSVGEFQIATARFTSEVGRSGNSIINIVTRSGGNQFHGSAFIFERNRHLQALPATFDRSLPVPPFDREQFGGSFGGPFIKDKAFFFSSVEYRNQNAAIQTGTRDFTTDSILNSSAAAPLREVLLSNRVDYHLNENNIFSLRYSFNRSTNTSQATAASPTPLLTEAERQNALNRFNSAVASWTRVLGSNRTNDLAFHYDNFYNNIPPYPQDAPLTNPQLNLGNELIFPDLADGANFNLPQATHLDRFQLRDNFAITLGKHNLRVGGEYQYYRATGLINVFGTGTIILPANFAFQDLNGDGVVNDLDLPVAVGIHSTAPITPVPIPRIHDKYIGLYLQDDWRVLRNLTLNLGLRWEYDTNATGQSSPHDPCPNLTEIPEVPCTWMANVIPLHKDPDTKDFGPRVGFVYDPSGRGRAVLRGGYGIYYDRIIMEAGSKELVQNDRALTVTQYAGSSCTNPNIPAPPSLDLCFAPGSSFAPGTPTITSAFSGPHQTGGVGIVTLGPNSHHPLFQQFSFGFQQQVGNDWLVSADGLHVFGQRQLIGSLLRSTTSTSPYIHCPGNNELCVMTDPVTGISDSVSVLDSSAKSWYDGLLVGVAHRPGHMGKIGYEYNISYTLSKTLDYSNDDQLENGNKDEQVNLIEGTAGLRKEKGYALADERHRISLYGNISLPYQISVAPIYTFGSGVPADTLLPSTSGVNGSTGARLPLISRNALGRDIKNSDQLNAAIHRWNALPSCPGVYPCNAGGPIADVPAGMDFFSPFSSFDMRLQKIFPVHDRMSIHLIGEVFNLFNEVNVRGSLKENYSGRNISISPLASTTGGVETNFYQAQTVAGGFFGSGGPRAFQFAARFEF